ncbi:MAG: hypothetical protein K0Q64_1280 [Nitrobacter vulgaris]|nr:hypothetical protein [Nitrobacter vulgaris]
MGSVLRNPLEATTLVMVNESMRLALPESESVFGNEIVRQPPRRVRRRFRFSDAPLTDVDGWTQ